MTRPHVRHRMPDEALRVVLEDGTRVLIRLIRPEDRDLLLFFMPGCGDR